MYLVKLMCFLTFCTHIPHVTTSSADCPSVLIHASDESSSRLPKCLKYCFSVLASAAN